MLGVFAQSGGEVFAVLLEEVFAPLKVLRIFRRQVQQIAAVRIFEGGDVVLHHAAQAHHANGVRAIFSLLLIAIGDDEAGDSEDQDDDDANRSSEQELEMEMLRTKQPLELALELRDEARRGSDRGDRSFGHVSTVKQVFCQGLP